ncbi:MAG TPA: inorganic phosphate transporter [Acidimicrobiia bacterium]
MNASLVAAFGMALAFAMTNGLHDSADAIATLVATRAARPATAVRLAAAGSVIGPLVVGKAVADTVASIVTVPTHQLIFVLGAGLTGAVAWSILTWTRGYPASSGHALLGGLVGAAVAQGGMHRVNWGGFRGLRPDGVLGTMAVLALAPLVGFAAGFVADRLARRAVRRATDRVRGPVRALQWLMTGALAFTHGANDTQKAVGAVTVILFAGREIHTRSAPGWVVLACSVAFTAGTALGGWPVVRTIGRRIVRLRPIDSLASQTASTAVLLAASIVGAPVSTTQVVASSVVGVGAGHGRWRHVHWPIVRTMLLAWLVTIPVTAALAAVALFPWRWFA